MKIAPLNSANVNAAYNLSQQAGWGMRLADWELLLSSSAVNAVGGYVDNKLIATTTVAQYGDLGWIGCVLVDEEYRRCGYGTEIFNAACETTNLPILGLDANPSGRPIYEERGFHPAAKVHQYTGAPPSDSSAEVNTGVSNIDSIMDFDRSQTGYNRGWLLRSLATDSETRVFVHRDCGVSGYAVLHPDLHGWTLGPIVADRPETTSRLVQQAADVIETEMQVRVPEVPTAGDVDWKELGFEEERTLVRMSCPPNIQPLAGDTIRAITAFAFG